MLINGKLIAQTIYQKLVPRLSRLKKRDINPSLAIILVGSDPASVAYVAKKKEKGEKIGITVYIDHQPSAITENQLITIIDNYNYDPNISGIIIQLPLPKHISGEKVTQKVLPQKDVDGFVQNSRFTNPIVKAVYYLLGFIIFQKINNQINSEVIKKWLQNKQIVVIGKGKTGGKPIFQELAKITNKIVQIDSQTDNPDKIIKQGNIIISCVGKKNILNRSNLKKGVILINVGLHKENNHLVGDYDETEIKNCASFYTPTPSGIGPVNVACLLENVIQACEK